MIRDWSLGRLAAVTLGALLLAAVVWTVIASIIFVCVMGLIDRTGLGHAITTYFNMNNPNTYWQWWGYLFDPDAVSKTITIALWAGAIAATAFVGAMIYRTADLYIKRIVQRPLHGDAQPATRDEMRRSGFVMRRKL
jgi:hypothetical protein